MPILATIIAALKAIPSVERLFGAFIKEWHAYDERKREQEALIRHASKRANAESSVFAPYSVVRDSKDAIKPRTGVDKP